MRRAGVALYVHLVRATWDRLPLLQGEIERQVYRAIGTKCDELGVEVVALGGIEDHEHLLASMPATLSVSDLAKHVKGASSHLIASQRRDEKDGFFKWQGAYGACTVSPGALREVARYVTNQRAHHAAGRLPCPDGWVNRRGLGRATAPGEANACPRWPTFPMPLDSSAPACYTLLTRITSG